MSHNEHVDFETELARVLPEEIPHRERLVELSARHLSLVAAANEQMNLTRIASPREAAIKHVFDSVSPWRFFGDAQSILDAGTGAGFPGIPLALVLPESKFVLAESVGKKARFVEHVVDTLELTNVRVFPERAEALAQSRRPEIITARAVAPVSKLVELFRKSIKSGSRLLLYKGPDAESELAAIGNYKVSAQVAYRYELPENLGNRTLIQISRQERAARTAS